MQHQHNNLYGIAFIMAHSIATAILYAAMKYVSQTLGSNQAVFLYKSLILVAIIPWILKDGIKSIYTKHIKLHLIRGCLSICGSLSFMYGLQHVNLADATALGYLEQVILVIIGMLYFQEKVSKSKVTCVIASFIGAFIIVYPHIITFHFTTDSWSPSSIEFNQPGFKDFNPYYLFILLGVLSWVLNCLVVKMMGKTEKTKVQLFYVTLFSCIFAFPFAFVKWKAFEIMNFKLLSPDGVIGLNEIGLQVEHFKYIVAIALCYFIHNVSFFKAFKYAEISTVIPFEYSKLVFTGILQYLVFKTLPEDSAYLGYILIVGSGIILIKSEARRRSKQKLSQKAQELKENYENV